MRGRMNGGEVRDFPMGKYVKHEKKSWAQRGAVLNRTMARYGASVNPTPGVSLAYDAVAWHGFSRSALDGGQAEQT